jgi:hypothetical protein
VAFFALAAATATAALEKREDTAGGGNQLANSRRDSFVSGMYEENRSNDGRYNDVNRYDYNQYIDQGRGQRERYD